MKELVPADLLNAIDIVVMERLAEGSFRVMGTSLDWFVRFYPEAAAAGERIDPGKRFTFLENFLIDAEDFWRANASGVLGSGLWIESDPSDKEFAFEATAVSLGEKKMLLIKLCWRTYAEKQHILQKGRELGLEYRRIARLEETLQRAQVDLREQVKRRTAKLLKANQLLKLEIEERKKAEKALRISEEKLHQRKEYFRLLAGKLIRAQEEERRRLARELYDDFTQRVAYLALEAGRLEGEAGGLPSAFRRKLRDLREYAAELAQDVNDLSRLLHPAVLDELGLVEALHSECQKFQVGFEIPVHFEPAPSLPEPSKEVAICLYRLVQEAFRNIGKHAGASMVTVSLTFQDQAFTLTITDNGIGFDVESVRKKGRVGLASMAERVEQLQGKFSIDAKPGSGTGIRACIPL